MSVSASSPPPGPTVTKFSVQHVIHTKISALTSSGKPTQTNKKKVKSKELSFVCTDTNYIGFLQAILDKHNEMRYVVLTDCHFPFKYYHMGQK